MSDTERDAKAVQLLGKTWAELEAVEHADRLLFPWQLRRPRRDGSLESVPVLLRVPRQPELRAARVAARVLAAQAKLDPDRDADMLEGLENLVILATCIRSTTAPHEPYEPDPLRLEATWEQDSLAEAWSRLEWLRAALDPAPRDMAAEQVLATLAEIVEHQSIAPLAGFAPYARATYIISTANLLSRFLTPRSSAASPDSSTPGPSSGPTSAPQPPG